MPPDAGLLRAENALREDQVDNVHQESARIDEDVRCDGEPDVVLTGGQGNAQHERCNTCHAETEEKPREDESMASTAVDLEYGHVGRGEPDVECYQDCADGYVGGHAGHTPHGCCLGDIGSA